MDYPFEALLYDSSANALPLAGLAQDLHNLDSCSSHWSTRAEDSCSTVLIELVVVLSRDNTTHNNYDILSTELLELSDDLRNECEVTSSE